MVIVPYGSSRLTGLKKAMLTGSCGLAEIVRSSLPLHAKHDAESPRPCHPIPTKRPVPL